MQLDERNFGHLESIFVVIRVFSHVDCSSKLAAETERVIEYGNARPSSGFASAVH